MITSQSYSKSSFGFKELERAVYAALETYSNVHRGTGHYSMVTTELYEHAREIVLNYLNLDKEQYVVIFCSPLRSELLKTQLNSAKIHSISSKEIGLPLGITALAIERKSFPKGVPFQTGGGTITLVHRDSVIWADVPDKFEAGTPSIINAIAFAKALQLLQHFGRDIFNYSPSKTLSVTELLHQDQFEGLSGIKLLQELQKTLIGRNIRVPTVEGERSFINFDNAASTPTFNSIWDVVCQVWRYPTSISHKLIFAVKKICAEFLGAPSDEYEIIFASNTTEAINLAAQHLGVEFEEGFNPVVVTTILEHHSNELPWRYIPDVSMIRLNIDIEGFMDLEKLEKVLKDYNECHKHGKRRIRIVAVSGASNVIGSLNDIQKISQIVHKYSAFLLVDAAQLVAHRKISIKADGIDLLAFSGHKVYAPFGSGALIVKKELIRINPTESAKIKLSGEENIIGIAALGKALTLLQRIGMDVIEDYERTLTRVAVYNLIRIPNVKVFGVRDINSKKFNNRGTIIALSLKNVPHNLAAKELAEYGGIGVRNGCFCAHMLVRHLIKLHPLRSIIAKLILMIYSGPTATIFLPGLVRVSFGIENDEKEIQHFIQIIKKIVSKPRSRGIKFLAYTYNGIAPLPHTKLEKQILEFTKYSKHSVYSLIEEKNVEMSSLKPSFSNEKSIHQFVLSD